MAVVWTKDWSGSDDGTIIKGIDIKNIQDDINSTGLADADKIQGFPVVAPVAADDGKALVYDDINAKFTYTTASGLVPALMLPYAGATAPAGWRLCDGTAISRTTFASLFTVIGTTYGVGDGSTTFNLPDLRGRMALGADNMGGTPANRVTDAAADTVGSSAGAESATVGSHALTTPEIPSHTHSHNVGTASGPGTADGVSGVPFRATTGATTGATGGGAGHTHTLTTTMDPYLTLNYIIKL